MAKLREKQVDDPAQVKAAFTEADGTIGVLKRHARAGAKSKHGATESWIRPPFSYSIISNILSSARKCWA